MLQLQSWLQFKIYTKKGKLARWWAFSSFPKLFQVAFHLETLGIKNFFKHWINNFRWKALKKRTHLIRRNKTLIKIKQYIWYFRSEDSSLDEFEIDLLEDADLEKDIFRTKSRLFVSDLSRKSSRVLAKKANLYKWNLMTIATFYALPVVQLVLTYQNVTNSTGNQVKFFGELLKILFLWMWIFLTMYHPLLELDLVCVDNLIIWNNLN